MNTRTPDESSVTSATSASQDDAARDLDAFQLADFSRDYRARALFSMVPVKPDGRLLDVGSGNGVVGDYFAGKFGQITLTDYSEPLVAALRAKFALRPDVEVERLDATRFAKEPTYDVIVAADIIEHLADDLACLRNCRAALRPGGVLFVSVPAIPALYGVRDRKYGHHRRYGKRDLRARLIDAGFDASAIELRYWNLVGVAPYWVSEKILRKELVGPARGQTRGLRARLVSGALHAILRAEARSRRLPLGLTLVAHAVNRS